MEFDLQSGEPEVAKKWRDVVPESWPLPSSEHLMRVHMLNTKHALTDDTSIALYWTTIGEDIIMYKGKSIGYEAITREKILYVFASVLDKYGHKFEAVSRKDF